MPATDVKTYNPADVQVNIGGRIITGYEAGTFIQLERSVNNYDWSIGPDGVDGIRTKRNDRSALLTVTLRQSSVGNLVLANLANRDEVSADGVVPVQITELKTNTRFVTAKGWIEKPPGVGYADNPQPRAWQIRLSEVPFELAGNPTVEALTGTLS